MLIDISSTGWTDAVPQMPVERFIHHVETGTFDFIWE